MTTKNLIFILSALFMIAFSSCQDDDNNGSITPSKNNFTLEGEGGELNIKMNNDNWNIAAVVNKDRNVRIYGDAFSPDGQKVREEELLELEGFGKLETYWNDKGFSILRSQPNELQITVEENFTGEEFSFGVILQNENETKEIVVSQKISQGYTFDKIEYLLQEDDKDSLYFQKANSYSFNFESPGNTTTIYPLNGTHNFSYFEYDVKTISHLLNGKTINVQVPLYINNGEVILSKNKNTFEKITYTPHDNEKQVTFEVPAGQTFYYVNREYRSHKVSYVLTFKNNRTGDKKSMQGKWIENTLTGNYQIIKSDE